ncbi:unnamed protein product [Penicillium roqueforti FM164]|uniref:Genomic scaffold, ProqFM164S03 n=1 Tax=Penicillium roqueforti (strain FM164) TaxID=1365484 RepID=W6QJK2_PENRF|nr:unnamed protein product [Penicillium roqueforti FM164]
MQQKVQPSKVLVAMMSNTDRGIRSSRDATNQLHATGLGDGLLNISTNHSRK